MKYKISDRNSLQVLGEWAATSFIDAAHKMSRQRWGVDFFTATASGLVTLDNLAFTAKTF
jgi:hypothetical protein